MRDGCFLFNDSNVPQCIREDRFGHQLEDGFDLHKKDGLTGRPDPPLC